MTNLQPRFTYEDFQQGLCLEWQVDTPKPPGYRPPAKDDPTDDDLLSDLGLARRLYRKDPERFIASHASVANKLLDIQEKAQSSSGYPSLTDHNAWAVLLAKIGKEASAMDPVLLPPPALLLRILHEAGGSISAFKAALRGE